MMNETEFIDKLFLAADRWDYLCSHTPTCPNCHSEQVQIMDHGSPARWRCRVCRHYFVHEPE